MISLQVWMIQRGWNPAAMRACFENYADETQCGLPRIMAFRYAFPGVDPFQFASDGYLSQYYNGPDREYDLD